MGVLERSLIGGGMILLIWAARAGLRGRVPGRLMLLLWAAALARLLLPVGLEVRLPVVQMQRTVLIRESLVSGVSERLPVSFDAQEAFPVQEDHSRMIGGRLLYGAGAGLSAAFFAALYLLNRRRLGGAALIPDAPQMKAGFRAVRLYESERATSPVSMGLLRPRIILPESMKMDEPGADMILRHELEHIRGFHGLWKLISAAAVCMHWFNPLVWIMRALIARDLELIADEVTLKDTDGRREEYAHLLIRVAEGDRKHTSFANGFGGRKLKERIVNVMKKRKNSAWAIVLAALLLMASVCAFAEPVQQREEQEKINIEGGIWTTMSREEFRQWYRLRLEIALAAGEVTDDQYEELIADKLDALLTCIEGDEIRKVTVVRHEEGVFLGEVNLIEGDDGVLRIVFASSQPLYDVVGAPVEQLGEDLVVLQPQAGVVFEAEIAGLKERGGVLYEAFAPGCSKEEAEAAGMVFMDQPVGVQEGNDMSLSSEVWQVDSRAAEMRLDGNVMSGALFQFVNGRLINIEMNAPDAQSAKAILSMLEQELGEAAESNLQGSSNTTRLLQWEFAEEDMTVRAFMGIRLDEDGDPAVAAVQVAWLPHDLFGDVPAGQE